MFASLMNWPAEQEAEKDNYFKIPFTVFITQLWIKQGGIMVKQKL